MGLFNNFSKKQSSKEIAKDRLRLILIHDRGDIPEDTIEKIRNEILEVLAKYIEIESEDVEIFVTKSDALEGDTNSALVANIPIKGVRER
ncbi:MAG: cell division topological specificity factor MinE [Clostridium sp.]|nr:cell division topological specificity factor MinE [Clostridium sp.]MCI7443408.1 cell division topological specificity factor MinE [Clostridium sp.]